MKRMFMSLVMLGVLAGGVFAQGNDAYGTKAEVDGKLVLETNKIPALEADGTIYRFRIPARLFEIAELEDGDRISVTGVVVPQGPFCEDVDEGEVILRLETLSHDGKEYLLVGGQGPQGHGGRHGNRDFRSNGFRDGRDGQSRSGGKDSGRGYRF